MTAVPKSVGTAYIFWALLGVVGAHQFYLGKTGRGISMLLTLGWLGVGMLVDLFTLESQTIEANRKNGLAITYTKF